MYYATREEAQAEIDELREKRAKRGMPPVERRIVEKWGEYETVVIERCSRCGGEVESRGAASLILCPACRKKKTQEDAKEADRAAEAALERERRHHDFEEWCQ